MEGSGGGGGLRWRWRAQVEVEAGRTGSSPGGVDDEDDLVAAWQGEGG